MGLTLTKTHQGTHLVGPQCKEVDYLVTLCSYTTGGIPISFGSVIKSAVRRVSIAFANGKTSGVYKPMYEHGASRAPNAGTIFVQKSLAEVAASVDLSAVQLHLTVAGY